MKKIWLVPVCLLLAAAAGAEFSFYLVDNFESGRADRWYKFGNVRMSVTQNPSAEGQDIIADSGGEFALKLKGGATDWYVGGVGTNLEMDASPFTRLQLDVCGSGTGGKLRLELFDDDNNNKVLEQDPAQDWKPLKDDKWTVEVPIFGPGVTRYSIPFSAFKLDNPGSGDGIWNPDTKNGSGGLLKMQIILLADKQKGEVEAGIDNIILTY
jgi:hypothetical protein